MRVLLRIACSLALALPLGLGACSSAPSGSADVPLHPVPFKAAEGRLHVYDGARGAFDPIFVKGMNLGIAVPGTQPGELAATEEDYDRWFSMLTEMGVNTVRLYTLHYPRFYRRLLAWNLAHRDRPLWVFHGIWLDEENPTHLLRDMQSGYDDNIVESIRCVHGDNYVFERKGRGHGEYDADISPWVLGWLVGREVFPDEVEATNAIPGARTSYEGRWLSIRGASESEVWWTERLDQIATYEAERYGVMRPLSMSSWPTLDGLRHPTEGSGGAGEDKQQIDLAKLDTSRYEPGYFASYHAYPYYPDFMSEEPTYVRESDAVGPNSYLGYLKALRAHYYPKPLVIAEVGVPSSWGNAHYAHSGMNHGGQDEIQQGEDDARVFRNTYEAGTGGAILFAWIDEWWKRTWIVDELAMPRERYRLWHNVTSPEQNFGLLGFEVDPPDFGAFPETRGTGRVRAVRLAADAEYFHVELDLTAPLADGERLVVGYDTYAEDRGERVLPGGARTSQRSELALDVELPSKADLLVTEAYDQLSVWFDMQRAARKPGGWQMPPGRAYRSLPSDGGAWNLVRWQNNEEHGSDDGTFSFPATFQDIGHLRVKRGGGDDGNQWAVSQEGPKVHVRVPWTLLGVTDPSQRRVIDDDPLTRPRETAITDGVRVAVALGGELVETPRFAWPTWEVVPRWRERRKASYAIFAETLKSIPDR